MKKYSLVILVLVTVFSCGDHELVFAGEKTPDSPNIILVAVNVLRADHVSSYGYERKTTPAIDALAKESSVFTKAFANAGYTMPSMMSIFTSLYPDSHQVYDAFKDEMSSRVKTLAEILQIHNYKTGWFTKIDAPHLALQAGFGRGFTYKSELGLQLEGKRLLFQWLKKNSSGPFFLAMNVRHTHSPYLPFPKYRHAFTEGTKKLPVETYEGFSKTIYEKFIREINDPVSPLFNIIEPTVISSRRHLFTGGYQRWKLDEISGLIKLSERHRMRGFQMDSYFELIDSKDRDNRKSMIAYYDSCLLGIDQEIIKPIINILREKGVYDNTLIIVTGDHGETFGEHGLWGHKARFDFYEQPIHVPLIIKMPRANQTRQNIKSLVQGIDIMPTILEAAGIAKPHTAQGKSLLPLLEKPDLELNEYVFGENRSYAFVRSTKWKLIIARQQEEGSPEKERLFDLLNDPEELRNAKSLNPSIYQELRAELDNHLQTLPKYVDKKYEFYPQIDINTQEKIKKTGYW